MKYANVLLQSAAISIAFSAFAAHAALTSTDTRATVSPVTPLSAPAVVTINSAPMTVRADAPKGDSPDKLFGPCAPFYEAVLRLNKLSNDINMLSGNLNANSDGIISQLNDPAITAAYNKWKTSRLATDKAGIKAAAEDAKALKALLTKAATELTRQVREQLKAVTQCILDASQSHHNNQMIYYSTIDKVREKYGQIGMLSQYYGLFGIK